MRFHKVKHPGTFFGGLLILLALASAIIFFIVRDTDPRLTKEEAIQAYHKIVLPDDFHLEKEIWDSYPEEDIPEQRYGEFTYSTHISLAQVTQFMAASLRRAGYTHSLSIRPVECTLVEIGSAGSTPAPKACQAFAHTYPDIDIVGGIHGDYEGNYAADVSWAATGNDKGNVVKISLDY